MVDLQLGEKYEIFYSKAVSYRYLLIWADLQIQTMASRMLFDSNDSIPRLRTPAIRSSLHVTMSYPMILHVHIT
jgi:hypothetical protein